MVPRKKKIAVIGHFMYGCDDAAVNGQTTKTKNICAELSRHYGSEAVVTLDTNYFRKKLVANYCRLISICRNCKIIIIMPTGNGLRLLLPVLLILKRICGIKILYPVIGGWLPQLLRRDGILLSLIHCVDVIYPETDEISKELKKLGLVSVKTMPNFSLRTGLTKLPEINWMNKPYRFCTFSRVTKEKGIGEAVWVVHELNNNGYNCSLDIFGPIDESYGKEFENLLIPGIIEYKGVLEPDEIVATLQNYLIMLFPTYYHGEGMPGSVLEAFAAGVPVIASDWHNNKEVVTHMKTGVIYQLGEKYNLYDAIRRLLDRPEDVINMKNNCLTEYKKYSPDSIMHSIYSEIEGSIQ